MQFQFPQFKNEYLENYLMKSQASRMIYKSLSQSIQTTKQIKKEDAYKFIF